MLEYGYTVGYIEGFCGPTLPKKVIS